MKIIYHIFIEMTRAIVYNAIVSQTPPRTAAERRKDMEENARNFIDAFIQEDIAEGGQFAGMKVHTRFPP